MTKPLKSYLDAIAPLIVGAELCGNPPITDITNDSRKTVAGSLFVAIPGSTVDGCRYIADAVAAGAAAVVCPEPACFVPGVCCVAVSDIYYAYALLAEHRFDRPAGRMTLIGITGTNGKTTTACLLQRMLARSGIRCGLISTIKYQYGDIELPASRTTPEAGEFQRLLALMADHRCEYVVMEVSSHGLDQRRTGSAGFAVSVFTNLTGDHLDYHHDMENYYQAKKRLFASLTNGTAVINTDDPYGLRLAGETSSCRVVTYGSNPDCRYHLGNLKLSAAGTEFSLRVSGQRSQISSCLPGEHNVYNLTGAIAAAEAIGIDRITAAAAVAEDFKVPGRLEFFSAPSGASVYIDYAHTDDALRRAIMALRPICRRRLIVVFGCGGDRDRTKRPRMGRAAAEADRIIITSDNPRSENPLLIIEDIAAGIPPGRDMVSEPDRGKALSMAVGEAGAGDIVLIAGKGHETYQEVNGKCHPFNDGEFVRRCFDSRGC